LHRFFKINLKSNYDAISKKIPSVHLVVFFVLQKEFSRPIPVQGLFFFGASFKILREVI